jgi:hypothetical protein
MPHRDREWREGSALHVARDMFLYADRAGRWPLAMHVDASRYRASELNARCYGAQELGHQEISTGHATLVHVREKGTQTRAIVVLSLDARNRMQKTQTAN